MSRKHIFYTICLEWLACISLYLPVLSHLHLAAYSSRFFYFLGLQHSIKRLEATVWLLLLRHLSYMRWSELSGFMADHWRSQVADPDSLLRRSSSLHNFNLSRLEVVIEIVAEDIALVGARWRWNGLLDDFSCAENCSILWHPLLPKDHGCRWCNILWATCLNKHVFLQDWLLASCLPHFSYFDFWPYEIY